MEKQIDHCRSLDHLESSGCKTVTFYSVERKEMIHKDKFHVFLSVSLYTILAMDSGIREVFFGANNG